MLGVAVDPQTGTDVTLAGLRGDLAHFRKLKGNGQMLGALRARNDIYRRILQTAGNGKDVKGLAREALATLEGVDDLFDLLRKVP